MFNLCFGVVLIVSIIINIATISSKNNLASESRDYISASENMKEYFVVASFCTTPQYLGKCDYKDFEKKSKEIDAEYISSLNQLKKTVGYKGELPDYNIDFLNRSKQ